ncbi:hypothetical protein [Deinococcus cellulosilyticus]|uniref:Uncharacterized protein n=1 Tax=Deinococcus cellulosilyticus (strain DSM 18568 / NBRC 106333 / KACC 11606 / 5516J-15) TaxID=1223518 RepID=A0A511N2X6_DEIC1|nr:hypothetical protein [Deinococcus cellulosilyticus]GEM47204.1 hypothetical protein DC3_28390 [Deinococcus cellulosilyticus NBRC 106333 = KACC 11606]
MAEKILTEQMLKRWSIKRIQKEFPGLRLETIQKMKKVAISKPDQVEVKDILRK